jgi:hypothetical protein
MLEFFEKSSQNLLAAEAIAGIGHIPGSGYMRAKVVQAS